MKVVVIVGARPNLIKAAPFIKAVKNYPNIECVVVHTGQHYDLNLSGMFFRDLDIPEPKINLNVSEGSPNVRVGEMIKRLGSIINKIKPSVVLIIGDVDSTLAGAVVLSKMNHIILAHAESGERSYDRDMPEEVNRVVSDHVSDLLFCSSFYAKDNLKKEGIVGDRVVVTGDLIIDNIINHKSVIDSQSKNKEDCILMTLHRPSNVDNMKSLESILKAIYEISQHNNIVFPIHPRTKKNIDKFDLWKYLKKAEITEPIGYIELMSLIKQASCVLTDSGGIQIESWYFETPCVTIRYNTEAEDTISSGANMLSGNKTRNILIAFETMNKKTITTKSSLWHGRAAYNMIDSIIESVQ